MQTGILKNQIKIYKIINLIVVKKKYLEKKFTKNVSLIKKDCHTKLIMKTHDHHHYIILVLNKQLKANLSTS